MSKTTLASLEARIEALKSLEARITKLELRSRAASIAYLKSKNISTVSVTTAERDKKIAESLARREQLRLKLTQGATA